MADPSYININAMIKGKALLAQFESKRGPLPTKKMEQAISEILRIYFQAALELGYKEGYLVGASDSIQADFDKAQEERDG